MKKIIPYPILLLTAIFLGGCYYDVSQELYPSETFCDTTNITYAGKILPLIQDNCYSCHSGSAPSGNINLDSYTGVKAQATNGKLIGTISHAEGFSPMPQGGNKLSSCEISSIQTWINNGTLNN